MDSLETLAQRLRGQRIALTGATGFIGRRLLPLLLAGGAEVRVLLRSRHGGAALRAAGAEVVPCDLAAGRVAPDLLAGRDILFHLAYDMRASGPDNLMGAAALFTAAEAAGVGRIVHVSSAVVYDAWPGGRIAEDQPWGGPAASGYRSAKAAMERRLIEGSLPSVILQPTIVYGPGSALWTDAPLAQLRGGGVILPDPPGLCAAVHVDDVVQALLRAALLPGPAIGERFLVSGPETGAGRITWADFYAGYARLLGRGEIRAEPMTLPAAAPAAGAGGLPLAARVSALARRLLGRERVEATAARLRALRPARGPQRPDPGQILLFMSSPEIDLSRANARLGYRPAIAFAEGLARLRV